jgi:hypothetical protein
MSRAVVMVIASRNSVRMRIDRREGRKLDRLETELVILITPILVKPVRDRGLATPLDRPAPPPPPGPAFVKAQPLPEPNSGLVFK